MFSRTYVTCVCALVLVSAILYFCVIWVSEVRAHLPIPGCAQISCQVTLSDSVLQNLISLSSPRTNRQGRLQLQHSRRADAEQANKLLANTTNDKPHDARGTAQGQILLKLIRHPTTICRRAPQFATWEWDSKLSFLSLLARVHTHKLHSIVPIFLKPQEFTTSFKNLLFHCDRRLCQWGRKYVRTRKILV